MKKNNIACYLGLHKHRWCWRKFCYVCADCGAVKNDLLHKIRNIIIFLSVFACFILVIFALYNARTSQMREYEQSHNCRYDYNELCYTQEQKPWLFND